MFDFSLICFSRNSEWFDDLICGIFIYKKHLSDFYYLFLFQGNELKLTDMFFNPEKLHEPGMIDDLIRGMSTTSMETLDQFITDEVK